MTQKIGGTGLTCIEAEAAMALVTEAVEDQVEVMGFDTSFRSIPISSRQRLEDAAKTVYGNGSFGGTDCSLPMIYAGQNNLEIDAFVVFTDSETWAGRQHPAQALKAYRKTSGIDARLAVVAMTANRFTIADPKDSGMLDMVGFDTSTPNILSEFISGRI
jgi:60 kDa SS-A/Ro ribonucleoprotein